MLHRWHSEIVHSGIDDIDFGNISLYGIDPDGPCGDIETDNVDSDYTQTRYSMWKFI